MEVQEEEECIEEVQEELPIIGSEGSDGPKSRLGTDKMGPSSEHKDR